MMYKVFCSGCKPCNLGAKLAQAISGHIIIVTLGCVCFVSLFTIHEFPAQNLAKSFGALGISKDQAYINNNNNNNKNIV